MGLFRASSRCAGGPNSPIPRLHHFLALREVLGSVVAPPERVPNLVGELVFDQVWRKAELFIQARTRHRPETVNRHLLFGNTDGSQRDPERVFGHRPSVVSRPREDPWLLVGLLTGERLQRTEDRDGLLGQGHEERCVCFRNEETPLASIEVNVVPLRLPQLTRKPH